MCYLQTVEQCDSEREQARALKLLFTLIARNPRHAREFHDMGGYAMLAKVLGTERCKIGYRILKVRQIKLLFEILNWKNMFWISVLFR